MTDFEDKGVNPNCKQVQVPADSRVEVILGMTGFILTAGMPN